MTAEELQRVYGRRFQATQAYRNDVWKILTRDFFQRFVPSNATVLDLGCGYGEFINNIQCGKKLGMDLNPASAQHLQNEVQFLHQSCSETWTLAEASLDVVFTSNFFEHLPDKKSLDLTLKQAWRCLKPGGRMICLGPNVKFLPGKYWDFWDHHLPLTELSMKEGLEVNGFRVTDCIPRFLPYTMINTRRQPLVFVQLYLRLAWVWPIFGRQFLVVAEK